MAIESATDRQAMYQPLADQLAKIQEDAGINQGAAAEDIQKLKDMIDEFKADGNEDIYKTLDAKLDDLIATVEEGKTDHSSDASWEQDLASVDELLRSVYPDMPAPSDERAAAALHSDFNATVLLKIPPQGPVSSQDLRGLQDFLSAHQGSLAPAWVNSAQNLLARAKSSDASQQVVFNDVAKLSGSGQMGKTISEVSGASGSALTLLSATEKAGLPGGLVNDTNAVSRLEGNPVSYIEESGPNYSLFNAQGSMVAQFARTENAVVGLNNGKWLQLSPRGLDQSTQIDDVSKLNNPVISRAYTLKEDGSGVNSLGTAQDVANGAAGRAIQGSMGKLGQSLTGATQNGSDNGPGSKNDTIDRVTTGGSGSKSVKNADGNEVQQPYSYVTVAGGNQPRDTEDYGTGTNTGSYVNFAPKTSGTDSRLWVNQGDGEPMDVQGYDPSKDGDGALFLPDGSVAIRSQDKGYVLSGGTVTDVADANAKVSADDFFKDHPEAKIGSQKTGFAFSDGSGQPNANQLAAMNTLGLTVAGYGANTQGMPKQIFDAATRNKEGGRNWLGVGDSTNGQTYVQYDVDTGGQKKLFASQTSDVKTGYSVIGANPDNAADEGSLFLADGSVAFKADGDAYVQSGDTVVSVTDPSKRQSADEFWSGKDKNKFINSSTAGLSNPNNNKVATQAQAAAMQKFGVNIDGVLTEAPSSTKFVTEPLLDESAAVPGRGVVALKPGDANYQEMSTWPDVQKVLKNDEEFLAPITEKAPNNGGGDNFQLADKRGEGTLENEGWQLFSVPGSKTVVMYNPSQMAKAPIHAFDTTTGKEVTPPDFFGANTSSGTLIFADGTRMDVKGGDRTTKDSDGNLPVGVTITSGDQITTTDVRVAGGASDSNVVQQQNADAVKKYLASTRVNATNTAVQVGEPGVKTQFAYSNNAAYGGGQAWGLAGDGSYGGASQPILNWLNDPNSSQNAAVSRALYPNDGYAPDNDHALDGWQDWQRLPAPVTKSDYDEIQKAGLGAFFSGFVPGAGIFKAGGQAIKTLGAAVTAAGGQLSKLKLMGEAGLRRVDNWMREPSSGARPAGTRPPPRYRPSDPEDPAPSFNAAPPYSPTPGAGEQIVNSMKNIDLPPPFTPTANAAEQATTTAKTMTDAMKSTALKGQDAAPFASATDYAKSLMAQKTDALAQAGNATERAAAIKNFTDKDFEMLRKLAVDARDDGAKAELLAKWTQPLTSNGRTLSDLTDEIRQNGALFGKEGYEFIRLVGAIKGKGVA